MTPLLAIVAQARAGALGTAWRLFRDAGYESIDDDAAVLSVRGRLLKDSARAAPAGAARAAAYGAAAAAYARAAEIDGSTYPQINAATLALLAGDAARARQRAAKVLERLATAAPDAETPYYAAATRAEALLLLGQREAAATALRDAVACAPRAWEDHAVTLRQFAAILAHGGDDAGWLDALRPPRTLHYAGHMALDANDAGLAARVAAVIAAEGFGAGFGSLAAGADIVVAEALLAAGGDLHVVLPAPPDAFVAASVAPSGGDWPARFAAALAAAASVQIAGDAAVDDLGIGFASEMAMGRAAFAASALATDAVQLVVEDGVGLGATARDAALWHAAGRRGVVLGTPRAVGAAPVPVPATAPDRVIAAVLRVRCTDAAVFEARLPLLAATIDVGPPLLLRPALRDDGLILAYSSAGDAAVAAAALHAACDGLAIGAHYGPSWRRADPFGGPERLGGTVADDVARIAALTPAGATYATEDFVAGLFARGTGALAEHVGDLDRAAREPMRLFALRGSG